MAQPTNTFSSFGAVGIKEDLKDIIYDISPTETPVMNSIGTAKATQHLHEWQKDSLASASTANKVIEGDDATTDASTPTTRVTNYTQISDKVPRVTGSVDVYSKAGRGSEMAYQMAKKAAELKRDVESIICNNQAKTAGNDTTAATLAGIPSWLATNTDKAADGSDPTGDGSDTRTDGTQRVFSESQLASVLQSCWTNGGNPDKVFVGAFNKRKFSGFTGGSTAFQKAEDKVLHATYDVYASDFGDVKVIPSRFSRGRDALILDTSMWAIAYARAYQTKDLAITGDSIRKQILVEYTVEARNEASSGIVADLTTS